MGNINEKIDCFSYAVLEKDNYPIDIVSYMNILLVDTESKHVAFENETNNIFFELSKKVEYENTILGIHRTTSIENEYLRIKNMSRSCCLRAVRFVITEDERIWSDNTHWTLAYIYKFGKSTKISGIPLYIVDFRKKMPAIYDCKSVVFDSLSDIKNAIAAAKTIQQRLDLGWRPKDISYNIGKLYHDMESIVQKENLL